MALLSRQLISKKLTLFYVVLCTLGFSMIENVYFFLKYSEILFIRANPAHMVFSAIWGSALGAWLTKEKSFSYFLFALFLGRGYMQVGIYLQ
ncbi:hypothetical protein CVFO_1193 [Isorropodon fossajaponicum endosymbiont JTNG4]|nr:hypothetical protein CVFO_1193 [Isorropodon fossajaponicum endosymbiont JTNG4]